MFAYHRKYNQAQIPHSERVGTERTQGCAGATVPETRLDALMLRMSRVGLIRVSAPCLAYIQC
eukprot:1157917-Pelagomonas_calceolata.AAC.4